jgi:hypothetical protein
MKRQKAVMWIRRPQEQCIPNVRYGVAERRGVIGRLS